MTQVSCKTSIKCNWINLEGLSRNNSQWTCQRLVTEVFKYIDDLNPKFLKTYLFAPKSNHHVRNNYILLKEHNSATYGGKSLLALGVLYGTNFSKTWKHHLASWRNASNYGLGLNADLVCGTSSEDSPENLLYHINVNTYSNLFAFEIFQSPSHHHWVSWYCPFVVVFYGRQVAGFRVPCIERSDTRLTGGMGEKCKHVNIVRNF